MRHPIRRGTAKSVLLEYADAQGERSKRQVMPIAIITDDARRASTSTYLQARCSIAKSLRTFRIDRIESISDVETGEVSTSAQWLPDLNLSAGQPFAWTDDAASDVAPSAGTAAVTQARRFPLRLGLGLLLLGYLIGRFRLIEIALKAFGVRHGLWL